MRILIDCDVLLDVALRRDPYFESSAAVLDWAESNPGKAAVAWHTFSNLHYLFGTPARRFIVELLEFVTIPSTATEHMGFALETGMQDIEDAMQVAAADLFQAQVIATRNLKDYARSPIKPMLPIKVLPLITGQAS